MHEMSAQMQGPSMAPANLPARIQVENMDVDNEPSSEDWNPGESSKRGMKGKGKQRQLETDHEMEARLMPVSREDPIGDRQKGPALTTSHDAWNARRKTTSVR